MASSNLATTASNDSNEVPIRWISPWSLTICTSTLLFDMISWIFLPFLPSIVPILSVGHPIFFPSRSLTSQPRATAVCTVDNSVFNSDISARFSFKLPRNVDTAAFCSLICWSCCFFSHSCRRAIFNLWIFLSISRSAAKLMLLMVRSNSNCLRKCDQVIEMTIKDEVFQM